jgi:ubiquinone/menaquinone biosynthesis C-methylase UbiE
LFGRDRGRGEDELRRELLAGLEGRVVEVGAGNGINFEHLPATVSELIAVEPEPYLRAAARERASGMAASVRIVDGVADDLPLAAGSVDALVVAGVLCSVPDQGAALAEFARVVRSGGELRFYEHVRSRRLGFARYQRLVDRLWPLLMGGCHTYRDTLDAIAASSFRIERCRGFGFPPNARAHPVVPRVLGTARRA